MLKSSQPRDAKIEARSADVSLDRMFRGLFALGGTIEDLPIALSAVGDRREEVATDGIRFKSLRLSRTNGSPPIVRSIPMSGERPRILASTE